MKEENGWCSLSFGDGARAGTASMTDEVSKSRPLRCCCGGRWGSGGVWGVEEEVEEEEEGGLWGMWWLRKRLRSCRGCFGDERRRRNLERGFSIEASMGCMGCAESISLWWAEFKTEQRTNSNPALAISGYRSERCVITQIGRADSNLITPMANPSAHDLSTSSDVLRISLPLHLLGHPVLCSLVLGKLRRNLGHRRL